jgi:hypothetical protein
MPKFLYAALALALAASISLVTIAASESPSAPAPARAAATTHRVAAGQAAPAPAARPAAVNVVMRDPGCHWFAVGSRFKTKLAVPGAAKLTNMDEAALKITGAGPAHHVNVGRSLALARGAYAITMVGQKPDDNTLHLTVR